MTEVEKTGVPVGQIIEFDCLDGKILDPKYKDNLDPDGNTNHAIHLNFST